MASMNQQRRVLRRGETKPPSVPRVFGPRPELRAPPPLPARPPPANCNVGNVTEYLDRIQLNADARPAHANGEFPSASTPANSELPPEFQPVTSNAKKFFSKLFTDLGAPDFGGRVPDYPEGRGRDSGDTDASVGPDHEAMKAWALQSAQALRESRVEDNRRMAERVQDSRNDESRNQPDQLPGKRDTLLREIETSSDGIDQIADIVEYMARNRGMGARKLRAVIEPARGNIRQKIGAEGLAMLDMLFDEQIAREAAYYGEDEANDSSPMPTRPAMSAQDEIYPSATAPTYKSRDGDVFTSAVHDCQLDTAEIIERVRDYGRLKKWADFRALYDSLSYKQRLEPELAIWTANTILAQGCVKESTEVLDKCWLHHANSALDIHITACLQIARATTSFYSDCKLEDAIQQLFAIRNFMTEGEVHVAPSPLESLVESQSHRLMQEAFREGVIDETVFKPILLARSISMTALLREDGRIDDAIGLACWAATWMEERQEKEKYLTDFLSVIERPVSQAEIWLELALLTTDSTSIADCRQRARDIYAILDLPCHLLNVEIEDLSSRSAQTIDNIPVLLRVAEDCSRLYFYIGQIRALQTACAIAVSRYPQYPSSASLFADLKTVVQHTGVRYLGIGHDLQQLTMLLQSPEHLGRAISRLREALDGEDYQMPAKLCTIMVTLGAGYLIIGDTEKALYYSKVALDRSQALSNLDLVATCVSQRATALRRSGSRKDLLSVVELGEAYFDRFAQNTHIKGQHDMCAMIIQAERRLAELASNDDSSITYHMERVSHWQAVKETLPSDGTEPDIVQSAEVALGMNMFHEAKMVAESALELFSGTNKTLEIAECNRILFHCLSNILLQSDETIMANLPKDMLSLVEMVAKNEQVIKALAQLKSPTQYLSRAARELYMLGRRRPDWKTFLYGQALRCLGLAAREGEKFRTGLVEDQGLNSLLQKRMFVSDSILNLDYDLGLRISLALDDAEQMWSWIQEYKAQALADVVGSQYTTARTLTEVSSKESAKRLLLEEDRLAKTVAADSGSGSNALRDQLDEVKTAIGENPLLNQAHYVTSARVELNSLDWLFTGVLATQLKAPSKLVLVDWVVYDDRVVRTTLDARLVPEMKLLDISAREIGLFKSRIMSSTHPFIDRKTEAELNKLDPLMAGLDTVTNEDDLLIFSPSGLLNALPLHALRIGRQIAIERNLIVYTSSLGVLKQCQERRIRSSADSSRRTSVPRTAVFSNFPGSHAADERDQIHDCVHDISYLLSADVYLEQAATSTQFIKTASQVDILHYHGHVAAHPNILEHALELHGDDPTATAPPMLRNRSLKTGHFTTRDAFSLQLRHNALVTVVGCGSGVQDVAAGDEPMGLMSALLCAGAATTIGTLWPIDSADGRAFAREFYHNMANQMQEAAARQYDDEEKEGNKGDERDAAAAAAGGGGEGGEGASSLINLAVALRHAVRNIKRRKRNAYNWAAFVMYGTWTM